MNENDACRFSQLHEIEWFPLKCKTKDSNTIKGPLRAITVAVTAALATMTGSEEPGGNRQCMVKSMFLI